MLQAKYFIEAAQMLNNHNSKKELSNTSLAKELHISLTSLRERLAKMGLVSNSSKAGELTQEGILKGGLIREHKIYGKYIAWPENLKFELADSHRTASPALLTSTSIGKHFKISATRTNSILSELGWIKKDIKGWLITNSGEKMGGVQSKDATSGTPYVRWPAHFLDNKILIANIHEVSGKLSTTQQEYSQVKNVDEVEFRKKYPANYRATDGHYVRSKAEMIIDNWLYSTGVIHAYERKLPIEEDVYSDFYIPSGNVFIEYWGMSNDPIYSTRKRKKIEIYRKNNRKLIELNDKEIENLDDILPRLLLEHGIKTE